MEIYLAEIKQNRPGVARLRPDRAGLIIRTCRTELLREEERDRIRLIGMLGSVPLFSGLGKKELENIAKAGREVTFDAGKTILKEGESGLAFFLILYGRVEVRKKGKTVQTLTKGKFFGEMTVIDNRPRSADVMAVEETRCFGLTAWSFEWVVRSDPQIPIEIMKELVRRIRQTEDAVPG